MKKVLSLFLSCIFVLGVCFSTPIVASAAEETTIKVGSESEVINGCTYVVTDLENKYCALKSYTDVELDGESGYQTVLSISGGVDFDEENYTITSIQEKAFNGVKHLKTLRIDSNITAVPNAGSSIETINYTTSKDETITFSGLNAIYTGKTQGVTINGGIASITYDNKETTDEEEAQNVSAVGSYTATVSLSESEVLTFDFTIDYLPTPENAVAISGGFANDGKYWFNGNEGVTVTPADGYYIAKVGNNSFESSVTFSSPDVDMKVQLKNSEEQITDVVTLDNIVFDVDEPTGTITLDKNNSWDKLLETITFGLFFKTEKNVTIEANDAGSGVKSVEYCVSTDTMNLERLIALDESSWQSLDLDGDKTVALTQNSKNIVYARITDYVGNVKYISSNGIVLYSDSEADTELLEITYKSNENEDVTVKFNGNTINSVTCNKGEFGVSNYTVDSDKIILKGEYLENLSCGEYIYTVSYNPLGVDFVSGTSNSEPAPTKFKVIVNKADITGATLPEAKTGLVYDGSEHELVSAGHIENGTVQYKLSKEDEWSNAVPKGTDADDYTVYYKISLGANHTDITGTVPVTIAKANSTVTVIPEANDLTYNGKVQSLIKEGKADGGVIYYSVNGGEWKTEVPTATNAGDYTVDYKVIGNKNYNDADSDSICVKIKQQPITITAEDKSIYVNQVIPNLTYTQKGLVSGHTIKLELNTNFNLDDPVIGDYPIIQDGEVVIKNSNDIVVTDNYDITFKSGNLTVENCTGHKGGTATCMEKAVCTVCGAVYGDFGDHNWQIAANGTTITATCQTVDCIDYKSGYGVKINLGTKDNLTYTGTIIKNPVEYRFIDELLDEEVKTEILGLLPEIVYSGNLTDGGIVNAGSYTATVIIDEEQIVTLKFDVKKATPDISGFVFTVPENLDYDGTQKTVTVKPVAGITDMGKVSVVYYDANGNKLKGAPVESGVYTVKAEVAESANYNATILEDITWCFTIDNCNHTGGTATCYAKAVCENCGASYGEMKPHTIGTKIEKYPNCFVEGESKKYCKNEGCKYFVIESIEVDPDKHDWENGTRETTTKPTCKTEGVCTITCANGCGKTTTEAIPVVADAHVLSEWVESPATCVKEGEKTRVCMEEVCDYKETEVVAINKDAHDMTGEWEIVKEVTCVTDGEKELKCKNEGCTHKVTETVKADGTSHDLTGWQITVEPKCTVEGELAKLCKNEGCTYKETSSLDIVVDNHDPAEEFTVVPATCISAGEKYKKCQNPDCTAKLESEELPLDVESHVNTEVLNAKEPTCLETGYTGDTFCKDCEKTIASGVVVDATGHTASEWIVDKEATFEEEGAQHKECTVCKEELQKAVIEKRSLDTPVVKIENAGNGIKVTWSQDEDAAGYTVYRSTYDAKTKKWSKWVNRGTADATKSSWVDKKVEHGVTYKFAVRAINDKYKSAYKETDALLYIVAPKVTCSITSTGIIVNWNKIDNADSYDVYRSVLVDGAWVKWTKIGSTKAEKNTFLDDKVESGVNYKYTVRVVDGKVKSGYVSSASIIYLGQPVLKITNSANGVTGNWEKIEGATGYTIYRSEYNPSIKKWTKWLNLGTTKATAKSFTDKTVKSGYKYKYTIRAINGKLKSTYEDSNQLIFLTQPTLTIANTASGIQGKWNKVDGATGYILYRSELKEDGSWTKWITLGTAKATAKSFTDKTVKSGVQYKYTIRAKNGNYKSSYIDSNTSIFLGIPTVKIANAETGVKVSWGKIEGATSYLVYRSEYNSSTKKWSGWKTLETVDTTSFVDETAVSNVKYKYTVRALNGEFRSYFTASTELLYLKAPTVTAEKIDEGIKVSWTKIEGATSYIIYRSELSEDGKWSKWTKLGTAGEKYTSCKDKTVKENVTYKYTVRAVSGKLMSYYVASEQILNGVVTESIPEEPKTDVVA